MGNKSKEDVIGIILVCLAVIFFHDTDCLIAYGYGLFIGNFQGILRLADSGLIFTVKSFYQVAGFIFPVLKGRRILIFEIVISCTVIAFFNLIYFILVKKHWRPVKLV